MQLLEHFQLKDRHTFHLQLSCRYWADFDSIHDLTLLFSDERFRNLPVFVIGMGSNLLFKGDYEGLLLHSAIQTIELVGEDSQACYVKVGSGVAWDKLVELAVSKGWYGAENLSGIPGEVGATPVQNIGAYGVEAAELIHAVEVYNRLTGEQQTLSAKACQFGYRDSVFKQALKDTCVVCYVVYRFKKHFEPVLTYGDLQHRLAGTGALTALQLRQQILEIRQEKLPDTNQYGNAGSFFMNPVISEEVYTKLQQAYPSIPGWKQADKQVKVPAAWCIEQAGFKGKRQGGAGVHPKQPLVLINLGNATPAELLALSSEIRLAVWQRFGIALQQEVLVV